MASRGQSERAPTFLAPGRALPFRETFEINELLADEYGLPESLAARPWPACRLPKGHWPVSAGDGSDRPG
jgi:hypothetical protein